MAPELVRSPGGSGRVSGWIAAELSDGAYDQTPAPVGSISARKRVRLPTWPSTS